MAHGFPQQSSSNSSGSVISNLSLLDSDNPADEFQRRLIQHARDKKRMRDAAEGDPVRVQAFSKARPRETIASCMNGAARTNSQDSAGSENRTTKSTTNIYNNYSAMADAVGGGSPNVPRQWATKGMQRNNFLRRINSDGPMSRTLTPEPADPDIIYRRRTLFTGDSPHSDVDWNAADADAPVPTIEPESPNGMRRSPLLESLRRRRVNRQSSLGFIEELRPTSYQSLDGSGSIHNGDTSHQRRMSFEGGPLRASRGHGDADDMPAVVAFKSVKTTALSNHEASAAIDTGDHRQRMRRPGSRELLKQLARASSSTPSPSQKRADNTTHEAAEKYKATSTLREANTNHRLPTPPDDEPLFTEIKRTTAADRRKMEATSGTLEAETASSPKKRRSLETLPRSALEAVLQSHGDDEDDVALGDATIAHLRGIVADDDTTELSELPLDPETLELINNVNVRVSKGEEVRQEEREQLQRMNQYLRQARSGVRSAAKGLKRVEQNFGREQLACDHCGCSGATLSDVLSRTYHSFLELLYTPSQRGGFALTWLGMVSVLLLAWSICELILSDIYCQPLYAVSMKGYGVDPDAPRSPFVAVTVLLQWPFGWLIGPFWKMLRWFTMFMINHLLGSVGVSPFGSNGGSSAEPWPEEPVPPVGFGQDQYF